MRVTEMAACAAVGCALLAGCASRPEIPYDRSIAAEIKTIGIVTPGLPDGPTVVLASSVGKSFGLVGALVDASMQASRDSKFSSLLQDQHLVVSDEFVGRLTAELIAEGYAVKTIPVKREKQDLLETYPADNPEKIDAYLDVVIGSYGYRAAGIGNSTPYRPELQLRARFVRAKGDEVLMQDTIVFNPLNQPAHVVTIAPDEQHQFKDFDSLMAAPTDAVAGLVYATDESAKTLAGLVK